MKKRTFSLLKYASIALPLVAHGGQLSEKGNDVIFKWTAQKPTTAMDAGYPHLKGVEVIKLLPDQDGQMNHHPILQRLNDRFFLMTTHHPLNHHESSQGRNCRVWVSDEKGKNWKGPMDLIPPPDDVTDKVIKNVKGKRPIGFPVRFIKASDGKVYGIVRIGYKIWDDPVNKEFASHHTVGRLAREIKTDGSMGEIFWIDVEEDYKPYPKLQYPDRSKTPLAKELKDIARAWIPEGGGLSPQGIRYPKPWRQTAPDGIDIAEYSTAWINKRAVVLGRTGNNEKKIRCHYMAWSDDGGKNWGPMTRTNIPTAQNWSHIGTLPDGRIYILGSLADNLQNQRSPLAIAISDDREHFNKVYSVFVDRIHAVRNSEIYDGYIWAGICHGGKKNAGRQDVAVVKIPIDKL